MKQDLSYTYLRCIELSNSLKLQCPGVAELPQPSLFGFKPSLNEIEKRRIDLEKWLCAIVWRCDVITCPDFQTFCNFQKLLNENWLDQPTPSITLNQDHQFTIVDFIYEPEVDDSLASKVTSLMAMFAGGNQKAGPPKSQVFCYRLGLDDEGEPRSKQLWKCQYTNRASVITWDEQLTILCIGFDNGTILTLRISIEKAYKEYSEFCSVVKHTDTVTGIAVNSQTGQIYSIGKDRFLITTDLQNPNNVLREKEFPYELTCMLQQKDQKRLLVGDSIGSIYMFHYDMGSLTAAHHISPNMKIRITSLNYCPKQHFLIVGSKEGTVLVFELGKSGKEKLTSLVSQVQTVENQKSLLFSLSTKELYTNFNNNVIIVDSAKVKCLYSLVAHTAPITKIMLYEHIGLLVTSSKDQSIKFWQYKYFPHTQAEIEIVQYRPQTYKKEKEQQIKSHDEEVKIQQKTRSLFKQQELDDDLDHWQD